MLSRNQKMKNSHSQTIHAIQSLTHGQTREEFESTFELRFDILSRRMLALRFSTEDAPVGDFIPAIPAYASPSTRVTSMPRR